MASSPKAIRKPEADPPFKTMTTSAIYRKIASKRQLKYDAVKYIFINVMIEAIDQAKHHGTFDLASMLRIKVEAIPCKRGESSKKIVKAVPTRWMRNLTTMP